MSSISSSLLHGITVIFHFLTANYFQTEALNPELASRKLKHIVIVGGSFAGVGTAHRILKQAAKTPTSPFKITLISRDSHFYWNIAAPRGIIPGQIPDEKLFQPIAAGFAQYPTDKFEFLLASATDIDVESKQLNSTDPTGKESKLDYDFLIIGTGSSTKIDTPLKSAGSTQATKDALHVFQALVTKAKTIAIAGAGPTGIEISGELAFEYKQDKKITLISSGPTVLEGRPASISKTAINQINSLNVDLKLNTKVESSSQLPDGRYELALSGGEKLIVDLYIPTWGVQPNSSWIPAKLLDGNGFVKVDEYLSIKSADGVWAIGDVSDAEPPQFWFVNKQSTHLAKNIILSLSGKPPLPYKVATSGMIGLQIGKKAGTGHFGSMKLPSFIVSMIRKTLFVENLPRTVDGSML